MKAYLRTLKIIHLALCVGFAVLIFIVYFFQNSAGLETDIPFEFNYFEFIVPLFAFLSPTIGVLLFHKNVKKLRTAEISLEEKKVIYQKAFIQKLVFIQSPALFTLVIYLLVPNLLYLILAFIILILMIILRPTDYRLIGDMNLKIEDFTK